MGLMYSPAEDRYDRITRIASRVFGTPIALVTLVAERCQWFKSRQGIDLSETPREVSFCSHAILSEGPLVVEDARFDARFAENPLVTGEPFIRFYAGHPVHALDGSRLGTLCIIDRAPRSFSDDDRKVLRDLAGLVDAELQREQMGELHFVLMRERDEFRRKAAIDDLTQLWNRTATMRLLEAEIARAARRGTLSVALVEVDQFKNIHDGYGRRCGDEVLAGVAKRIGASIRDFDVVGRHGGETFLVVLSNCERTVAETVCERIRQSIVAEPIATSGGTLLVTVSIGMAALGERTATADAVADAAERALHRAKTTGRKRVVHALGNGPNAGIPSLRPARGSARARDCVAPCPKYAAGRAIG